MSTPHPGDGDKPRPHPPTATTTQGPPVGHPAANEQARQHPEPEYPADADSVERYGY